MVSVCLPSDALLQQLQSYLGFSYLERGVSLHGCSSKAQSLLLTLDEGYLLTAAPPDLEHGVAPLGPPALTQPPLLGCGVAPLGLCPWPQTWGISSQPLLHRCNLALMAAAPDLGRGVALLGHASDMKDKYLLLCSENTMNINNLAKLYLYLFSYTLQMVRGFIQTVRVQAASWATAQMTSQCHLLMV